MTGREPAVVSDLELLEMVDRFLAQPLTRPHRLGRVLGASGVVAVIIVGAVILTGWRLPWRPSRVGQLISTAKALSSHGDHDGAVRTFAAALNLNHGATDALDGEVCELWKLGYRDDALFYLQRSVSLRRRLPAARPVNGHTVRADCILDDVGSAGVGTMHSGIGPLVIVEPTNDRDRELLRLYQIGKQSRSGWRELLVAACLNTHAGLDYLASYQMTLAFAEPDLGATSGALLDCIRSIVPTHFRVTRDKSGNEIVRPKDIEQRVYIPGRSPVPPPTTIALPPPAA